MAEFKVGIIGCGGIANAHARVLTHLRETALVAFCDTLLERAEQFNQQYAGGTGHTYTSFEEMFDKEPLDIVYICLPPFAHSKEVQLAAQKGVHLFIEKPIALTLELGQAMVEAVEKAQVKSQVGFMSRFGEAVEKIKTLYEKGEIGQPGLMVARYYCNSLHAPWWRDKSKSGGQVVEQIIHLYDLTRYLLGEPSSVFCRMNNLFHREVENYTSEDLSGAVITYEGGAIATISGSNAAIPGRWMSQADVIFGGLTVFLNDPNHATFYYTAQEGIPSEEVQGTRNLFEAETLDLLNAIRENRPTRTPIQEGWKTLRLVLAARESAETGQVISLTS